ncbi:hypothetical protein AOCH_007307 [Aspergillus ochraceoroseus]|uniref:Uncharacterized protein n=1 Tax=Aspergillus ochraceoroseus TaxID=138278 RepID=A0A0F8WQY8_9EURO|nr:hypothetical protein AOCH_007307 [Aspergillus ochraceoroseus]
MGQKISAVNGVKSDNYFEPGNAINQIWYGDVEMISRLPFGDTDMGQAGWASGFPKIPWHDFIIPLKRDLNTTTVDNPAAGCCPISLIRHDLVLGVFIYCLGVTAIAIFTSHILKFPADIRRVIPRYSPDITYTRSRARLHAGAVLFSTLYLVVGLVALWLEYSSWSVLIHVFNLSKKVAVSMMLVYMAARGAGLGLAIEVTVELWHDWRRTIGNPGYGKCKSHDCEDGIP